MGIFDKVKDAAGEHRDKIDQGIQQGVDRAGDMIDEKTGGKFAGQVDKGQDMARDQAGKQLDDILGNEQGGIPPVEGTAHAENAPGEDVLDRVAEHPTQG